MSQDRHPTEDLPAYALGVLDRDEREVIAAHLETCAECARDVAQFHEAIYDVAAVGSAEAGDPPRGLRTQIVLRHRDAPVPSATRWGDQILEFLLRPVPAAVPAALAVLLVVAFVVVGASRQQAGAYERALAGVVDGRVVALAPTGANPDARGAVVIPTQGSPYLVARLPAPPPGKVWEAWVLKPGASGPTAIPAGTTERGDVFTLSLTVPLGDGDGVAITLESASGPAQPTTQPVLLADRT
jgi:anti-sigma-K factor RskA/putative zinc finger protein